MTKDGRVILAHGNGGRLMRELIDEIFACHLANPSLDVTLDAAPLGLSSDDALVMSTDGFVVKPLEFPGGTIGSLAVNGTVNDLAVSGARPDVLTLSAIIEEGLEIAQLDRIAASLGKAAKTACVRVIAGDTKVVPRGEGGGLYLVTAGVGSIGQGVDLGMSHIRPGDTLVISGPIGDHGVAVLLAREDFEISGDVFSDCAPVTGLTVAALEVPGLRFMRDPTRGGLATVAHEIASKTGFDVTLDEAALPVREPVSMVCEMLGYDPLFLAGEGRVVAVISAEHVDRLVEVWRDNPQGRDAAIVGQVGAGTGRVALRTRLGGSRVIDELVDDPLPRIC